MRALFVCLIAASALVAGCGKDEPKTEAASDSLGVKECDDYFAAAEACFAKSPEVKAKMGESIKQVKAMLKSRAAMPGEKEKLVGECKQHMDLLALSCK